MGRETTRITVRSELAEARREFHAALASLSEAGWRRQSKNAGWTNGEICFHMFLAFQLIPVLAPLVRLGGKLPKQYSKRYASLLNGLTGPFNRVNAFGARAGARLFTRQRIWRQYDRSYRAIVRMVESVPENEWQAGMYYPTEWDALFSDYMTLEQTFLMPVNHMRFHVGQLSR
jgi:hypothetical protein